MGKSCYLGKNETVVEQESEVVMDAILSTFGACHGRSETRKIYIFPLKMFEPAKYASGKVSFTLVSAYFFFFRVRFFAEVEIYCRIDFKNKQLYNAPITL